MTDEAKTNAPKEKKRGVGTVIQEALLAGGSNEDALAAALKEFPEAGTNLGSVSWYRNKMRKDGKDVPKARDVKKADDPLA